MDKKLEHHKLGLDTAKQLGDKTAEGMAHGNLAFCYKFIGKYEKAIEHLKMQLDLAKQTGHKAVEGGAYGNLGLVYRSIGKYNKAIEHHKMHLDIAKQLGNKAGEGMAYGNLGLCYRSIGKYNKAFEHHKMHLDIAKQLGNKAEEGNAYCNLGLCYQAVWNYDKALEHHKMHLGIAKQLGDKVGEGKAYQNLGTCYHSMENNKEALEHHKMHLDIAKQLEDKPGEGMAYCNLGVCYESIEEYEKALEHQKVHLQITKQLGERAGEAKAYGNLGNCYESIKQYDEALNYHKMDLDIAKQLGDKDEEGRAYRNLGHCYQSIEKYEDAEYYGRKSLECIEELFDHVPESDQFKVSYRESFVPTLMLLIESLISLGERDEALVIAERGHARALTYLMLKNYRYRSPELTAYKALDLCQMREVVKTLDSTVLYFFLDGRKICIWIIQPTGDVAFKDITMQVSSQANIFASTNPFVSYVSSLFRNAEELLRSGFTTKCEDRSLSFFYQDEVAEQIWKKPDPGLADNTTPRDVTDSELQMSRSKRLSNVPLQTEKVLPASLAERLYEAERNPLEELYQKTLGPVRQFVEGPRVVIVPDGSLPLVPFAALVDEDGHYVAESLQISLMPSLAIAKMITACSTELKCQTTNPLIVGDPHVPPFKDADGKRKAPPRLPKAMEEAQMIGKVLSVEPVVAEAATKENVLQRITSANLIHIAAHGDAERGEILLAPNPGIPKENFRKEDVILTISELERKRLRAKLVVLSCCNSGQGKVKAEGVIGIARAFLGAGARAVLVSLWALNDEAALYFMAEFYRHLFAGERANEALNRTMRSMRDHDVYWHPYYWAPFVLIGDDVTPFPKKMVCSKDVGEPS